MESGNSALKWLFLIIAFLLIIGYGFKKYKKNNSNNNNTENNSPIAVNDTIFKGFTPCNPIIDCKAIIKTFGVPVYEKFTGTSEPFYYNGGIKDPGAPDGAKAGPVHMASADSINNPHIWVVIVRVK